MSGLFYFWRQRIWLSGWVPIVAGLGLLTLFYSRKLTLLFVLVLAAYIAWNGDMLYRTIVQDNVSEGGLQRLDIWRMNLGHVANHPIFGMGPAGYAIYNVTYHPRDARSTHNNYFDVLAQNGVLGLIAFAALAATAIAVALRARRAVCGRGDMQEAFANAAVAGLPAAFLAMMLGDWVLPFAYNVTIMGFDHAIHTWLVMGVSGWLLATHTPGASDAETSETGNSDGTS
jgi:O-antigen ligase